MVPSSFTMSSAIGLPRMDGASASPSPHTASASIAPFMNFTHTG